MWRPVLLLIHYKGNVTASISIYTQSHVLSLYSRDTMVQLHGAANFNAATTTACLIKSSADLDAFENFGFTPLLYAINDNKVETATVLLRHGADHKTTPKAGNTILHVVANIATIPMLVMLTKARMRGLGLEARDEVPEAFTRAFDRLIRSILDEGFEAGTWTSISSSGILLRT